MKYSVLLLLVIISFHTIANCEITSEFTLNQRHFKVEEELSAKIILSNPCKVPMNLQLFVNIKDKDLNYVSLTPQPYYIELLPNEHFTDTYIFKLNKSMSKKYLAISVLAIDKKFGFIIINREKSFFVGSLSNQRICATKSKSNVYFQISGKESSVVRCYYKRKNQANDQYTEFPFSPIFNESTKRWRCAKWAAYNPGYDIKVSIDKEIYYTTEDEALANKCI